MIRGEKEASSDGGDAGRTRDWAAMDKRWKARAKVGGWAPVTAAMVVLVTDVRSREEGCLGEGRS